MRKSYTIQLDRLDLGQLLDGLEWRDGRTPRAARRRRVVARDDPPAHGRISARRIQGGRLHRGGRAALLRRPDIGAKQQLRPTVEEADDIAAHYRSIVTRIREQMEAQ